MFCVLGLIFSGDEGVVSRFHILRARTRFRWYLVRRVPTSCFARPFSFSAVPRAFGPVIMFCSPILIFGGSEGVGTLFNVLRVRTCFLGYRGRRVPFSCFARPDSFSAVSSVSCPYFMFCAPVLVFSGTGGVGSHFHILLSGLVFSGTEGVGSRFHVLLAGLIFGCTEGVGSLLY
jgi:hypothetical protein